MLWNVLIVLSFMSRNSTFLYFTLIKDGVNVIVYLTCLYMLLFCYKKKKTTRMQVWVKSQKLCHNCPAIYLFSGKGGKSLHLKPC